MLQTMTTETICKNAILDIGVVSDDGVLIKYVVLVIARPATLDSERLKLGNPFCEFGPHDLVEKCVIYFVQGQIIMVILWLGCDTAKVTVAFGSKPDASRVNQERSAF